MDQNSRHSLEQLLSGAVAAVGYELLGFEFLSQGKHSLLRVYLDSPNGINIDDCEKASRQISAVLEVEDPIAGQYRLEVSSPGLERPLFKLAHYQRFIQNLIKFRLHEPYEGQRNFKGMLIAVHDDGIDVDVDGKILRFQLGSIEKANLLIGV